MECSKNKAPYLQKSDQSDMSERSDWGTYFSRCPMGLSSLKYCLNMLQQKLYTFNHILITY